MISYLEVCDMCRFLMLLFIGLVVVGCGSVKKENVYVTEYEYITYEIPARLTTSCKPTKPISNLEYSKLTEEGKQTYLANYVIKLMGDLKVCDSKIKSINKIIKENDELIKNRGK